jgi:hypothetical protein
MEYWYTLIMGAIVIIGLITLICFFVLDVDHSTTKFIRPIYDEQKQQQQQHEIQHPTEKVYDKGIHMCSNMYYDVESKTHYGLVSETPRREGNKIKPFESKFYQICVSRDDEHYHVVEVFVEIDNIGDVDLYLSSHIPVPKFDHHTWNVKRPGNKYIKLKTNLYDWDQNSNFLFIAVRNSHPTQDAAYKIRAVVSKGESKRTGARLRGTHTAFVNLDVF